MRHLGSSPRVRGAGLRPGRDRPLRGIIPACAGSSAGLGSSCPARWDHPHVCGEQWVSIDYGITNPGSSPRMRGAVDRDVVLAVVLGIIPARAGSSCKSDTRARSPWDHPRACGEQRQLEIVPWLYGGSSPRVRGAGSPCRGCRSGSWDHPRACGEQPSSSLAKFLAVGSSPRVRGAGVSPSIPPLALGIIPARAGSS